MNDSISIFEEARKMQGAKQQEFLQRACGPDQQLRDKIIGMLKAAEEADAFFKESFSDTGREGETITVPSLEPGMMVGRYKLLQNIGEGGMGVVFMAEQTEPIRRKVALKIIKLGMDSKNVIARFEAERQALGLMDHPNIAKVLDAGTTETGRPYFVMELVRGVKITEYCDSHNISAAERLKLFTQVCMAVQHAHQKGVIHRDLKPSNILVTLYDSVPVVKIIDFGIAKATHQPLTEKTLFTAFAQFIGTPAYMSPEQAEMSALDVDTRSDVYSLGVLLYELLTGSTPFNANELMKAGLDEIRRVIRTVEPARPSTRLGTLPAAELTTVAGHRQSEPAKLARLLHGELDWVVMKALEKDRNRRYQSASELAADILRHLNREAVLARPPSAWYRFGKVVARNKVPFASGFALAACIIIALCLTTFQFYRAQKAEALAKRAAMEAKKAQELANQNAQRAAYLAQMEHDARMALLERNRDSLVSDVLAAQSGKGPKLPVLFEGGAPSGALLSVAVESKNGEEVYTVRYSRDFLEVIDRLSTALSMEVSEKGVLSNYLSLPSSPGNLPEVPRAIEPQFRSEHQINERISHFNSLTGTLVGIYVQAHYKGYSKLHGNQNGSNILGALSDEETLRMFSAGVRYTLDSGVVAEGLIAVLRHLDSMPQKPWWSFLFIKEGKSAAPLIERIQKVQQDYFAGANVEY